MIHNSSLIPFQNKLNLLLFQYCFQNIDDYNFSNLYDITLNGYPVVAESVGKGVQLLKNFCMEMQKEGINYLYYHIILCSSTELNNLIYHVKVDSIKVKSYVIILDNQLDNKIIISTEDNMRIFIIKIHENNIYKVKDLIKFSEQERKAVVYNVEASNFINKQQWLMICEFIKECTSKLSTNDCVSTLIFNDKIIYLPSNDIPKDKQNWNYSVKINNNNVE